MFGIFGKEKDSVVSVTEEELKIIIRLAYGMGATDYERRNRNRWKTLETEVVTKAKQILKENRNIEESDLR